MNTTQEINLNWMSKSAKVLAWDIRDFFNERGNKEEIESFFERKEAITSEALKDELLSYLIDLGYPKRLKDGDLLTVVDIAEYAEIGDKAPHADKIKEYFRDNEERLVKYTFNYEKYYEEFSNPFEIEEREPMAFLEELLGGEKVVVETPSTVPTNEEFAVFKKVVGLSGATNKPQDYDIVFDNLLSIKVIEISKNELSFTFEYKILSEKVIGRKLKLLIEDKSYTIYEFKKGEPKEGTVQSISFGKKIPWKEIIQTSGQTTYRIKLSE